jgi:hypothetical protein
LTIMGKISMPKTGLLYRLLKAGPHSMGWDFARSSVIGPDGQPMELEGMEHDHVQKMQEMMMNSIASKDL